MKTNFRNYLLNTVLNKFMLSLNCTRPVAESLVSGIDGIKLQGIAVDKRDGYLSQLLYKMGITPSDVSTSCVKEYLDMRSILCDVTKDAKDFCNPVFPFVAGITYSASSASTKSTLRHGSIVPARHMSKMVPVQVPDFYFVEEYMPQDFFVMANNSKIAQILEHGICASSANTTKLWVSKVQAQDAFLGGVDGLHIKSPSLTGWDRSNYPGKGTLISINSYYLPRDPKTFYPLHRKSKFIAMVCSTDIPASALSVVDSVDSNVLDANVYGSEKGFLDAEKLDADQQISQLG